ncbi:hypothetical protein P154DRAFT_327482 [Amniculicola lignicola CBS 123094]|uniref:Uncharacterized protein n=1 Tax=Amniculicola lignicola CBS 123094 TaxID=1392246 RepID=A0A6A5W2G5_9PLEO|nr:hypothetical protein P154DRAFT_327482 [Amniculicola lignicola CBS 123094]
MVPLVSSGRAVICCATPLTSLYAVKKNKYMNHLAMWRRTEKVSWGATKAGVLIKRARVCLSFWRRGSIILCLSSASRSSRSSTRAKLDTLARQSSILKRNSEVELTW